MTTLLGVGFIYLSSFLAQAAPDPAPATQTNTLVVATFNILHRNRDLPGVVRAIEQTDADLVALQETNPESETYLRQHLARRYPHMHFHGRGIKSDGFALLSRRPVRPREFIETSAGGRGGWIAEWSAGPKPIWLVCVHLSTPTTLNGAGVLDKLARFTGAEADHEKEMRKIHAALPTNAPVIFLGDFNSLPFGRAVQYLLERGYSDSFAAATPDSERHGTWTPPPSQRAYGHLPLRLDYILHHPSLRTVNSRIVRTTASDHAPVVSTLTWRLATAPD